MWQKCSNKLLMNSLDGFGGMCVCIFVFLALRLMLTVAQPLTMVHFGHVQIPSHSMKALHKPVYETVEPLWR